MPINQIWASIWTIAGIGAAAGVVATLLAKIFLEKYIGKYLEEKGANLAKREDLKFIEEQLRVTTSVTKRIEQIVNVEFVNWQSNITFMERQLDEFYYPLRSRLVFLQDIEEAWVAGQLPGKLIHDQMRKIEHDNYDTCIDILYSKSTLIAGEKTSSEFLKFISGAKVFNLYTSAPPDYCVPDELEHAAIYQDFDTNLLKRLEQDIELLESKLHHCKYDTKTEAAQDESQLVL